MFRVGQNELGKALYAVKPARVGDLIVVGSGRHVSERTRHSLQVDHDAHIIVSEPIELINHSCEPNCGIEVNAADASVSIYARREIASGEELTIDYASFEYEIHFMPHNCLCGSKQCRGAITGYKDLNSNQKARLLPFVAAYLKDADGIVAAYLHAE